MESQATSSIISFSTRTTEKVLFVLKLHVSLDGVKDQYEVICLEILDEFLILVLSQSEDSPVLIAVELV